MHDDCKLSFFFFFVDSLHLFCIFNRLASKIIDLVGTKKRLNLENWMLAQQRQKWKSSVYHFGET